MAGKVCLRCKGKTLLSVVSKLSKAKCLLTSLSNFLPVNFAAYDLNFHWRWRWWNWVQAIFLNLFYFIHLYLVILICTTYLVQTVDNTGSTTTTISTKCNWFSSLSLLLFQVKREWSCLFYFRPPWFSQLAFICLMERRLVNPKSPRNFRLALRKGWKIASKSRGGEIFSACITQ